MQADSSEGLRCLECGASLPDDAVRCASCGNDRLIMAARWSPPGDDRPHGSGITGLLRISREARVLVGLSLALFCALWLLGGARDRTTAHLRAGRSTGLQVASAGPGDQVPEIIVDGEPAQPGSGIGADNIGNLRLAAVAADNRGEWLDAIEAWTLVTNHPDAALEDYLELAQTQLKADDPVAAVDTLNRACVRFPDQPDGFIALGALRERQGNLNAARFQYEVGLENCPDSKTLRDSLSRVDKALANAPVLTEPLIGGITPQGDSGLPDEPESPGQSQTPGAPEARLETGAVQPINNTEDSQVESPTDNMEEPRETGPVTLIGSDPGETDNDELNRTEGTENAEDQEVRDANPAIEVLDLKVSASQEQVRIEIVTNQPAVFSTSRGDDPPRLFVRIPDARIAAGASFLRSANLNVPLVERINFIENADSNMYVSLVIYLGADTRHSVAAESRSVIITISRAATEQGG